MMKEYRVTRRGFNVDQETGQVLDNMASRQGFYFNAANPVAAIEQCYEHLKQSGLLTKGDCMFGLDVQEKW